MVTTYIPKDHVTARGIFILLFGSIVYGVIMGVIAYVISLFFYFFVLFPLLFSSLCVKVFENLFYASKIQHKLLTIISAILIGVSISTVFSVIPYYRDRYDAINTIQQNYNVNQDRATEALDYALFEETGYHGFWAYLVLNAREGVVYTNYFMVHSIVLFNFNFTLQGFLFWVFLITQAILFCSMLLVRAYTINAEPFNFRANDFYNMSVNCIGAVPSIDVAAFMDNLKNDRLEDARRLIVPEMEVQHPKVEIYENFPKVQNGDSIIAIKQTYFDSTKKIKRKNLGRFEVVPNASIYNQ